MANNVQKLAAANLVDADALDADDQKVINNLTDAEVDALISIKGKLPASFVQKHFGGGAQAGAAVAQVAPASRTIGIVF